MDDIINQNLNKMMNIKEKNKINLFLIIFFIFLISKPLIKLITKL